MRVRSPTLIIVSVILTEPAGLGGWFVHGSTGISSWLCARWLGHLGQLPRHSGGQGLHMWGPGMAKELDPHVSTAYPSVDEHRVHAGRFDLSGLSLSFTGTTDKTCKKKINPGPGELAPCPAHTCLWWGSPQ